jgi:hypothetical protein
VTAYKYHAIADPASDRIAYWFLQILR